MEVDREPVLGCRLHHLLVIVDHVLVVAVHVIDLDAGGAPFLVKGHGLVHVPPEGLPLDPQQRRHALRLPVSDDRRDVDLGPVAQDVFDPPVLGHRRPPGVDEHVLELVPGREIDVVLHRGRVHARLERDARGVASRPPVPGRLARLDPRRVGDRARRAQVQNEVVPLDEPCRVRPDHEHPPGGRFRRRALHRLIEPPARSDGQPRGQRIGDARDPAHIKPGVIGEIGLEQRGVDPRPRHLDEERQIDERGRLDVLERRPGVFSLVARVPAPEVQGEGRGVLGEVESRRLRRDRELADRLLLRQHITEGDSLVIRPQHDVHLPVGRVLLAQGDDELAVLVRHRPLGPERVLPSRVVRPLLRPDDLEVMVERIGARKIQSERRIGQDRRALVGHPIVEPLAREIRLRLGRQRDRNGQAPVRRRDGHRPRSHPRVLRRGAGPAYQRCDRQNETGGQSLRSSETSVIFSRAVTVPGDYICPSGPTQWNDFRVPGQRASPD